jgi:pimeloyl-ACP methyl ester carboxylesterase
MDAGELGLLGLIAAFRLASRVRSVAPWFGVALALTGAIGGGCAFFELIRQADRFQREVARVQGELRANLSGGTTSLVLVLSRDAPPGERHPVEIRLFRKPGPFLFLLSPGRYEIAAYQDRSGDLAYHSGDALWLRDEPLTVAAGESVRGILFEPRLGPGTLPARFDISKETGATALSPIVAQLGEVVSLDDPRLSLEMGRKGLWRPGDYLEELEVGLFFLEPYEDGKTPVLFVHGIGGAPVQFRPLIEALDRSRYQPWLLAYPSALPLSLSANALYQMMEILDQRYDLERVYVLAHSMGGLVVRGFVKEYSASGDDDYLRLMVTVATPFGGHSGARFFPGEDPPLDGTLAVPTLLAERAAAAQRSPGASPPLSWRDMKPESRFVRGLFGTPLPASLRFHLVFAFLNRASLAGPLGDGVVALSSQLREEAQREASSQRGFALGHDAVLESAALREHLAHLFAAAEGR